MNDDLTLDDFRQLWREGQPFTDTCLILFCVEEWLDDKP